MVNAMIVVHGTGSIGMRHAEVFKRSGRRVVLFPKREARASVLRNSGWNCIGSWKEADKVGATHAVIATDNESHVTDTISAINAGLIVLVEKPLAISVQAASPLVALSTSQQERIYCGFTMRYAKGLNHLKACLNRIGTVHSAFVECRSWLPEWRPMSDHRTSYSASPSQGGVLRDLIHEIDYVGWTLGWPLRASADLVNAGRLEIMSEEQAFIHLVMPGGVRVQVALDYMSRPTRRNFFIFGEEGTLHWDAVSQHVHFNGPNERQSWHFLQTRDETMKEEHDAFLDPFRGKAVGFEEALRSLAVCDAARESALSCGRQEAVRFDMLHR